MVRISKSRFKMRALKLLRQVERSGESVIVTARGRPVIEVRSLRPPVKDDALEALRGSLLFYDRPTEPIGDEEWEALR